MISLSRAALALLLLAVPALSHGQSHARADAPHPQSDASHARSAASRARADVFVPNLRYFRIPIADPHGARMSAALFRTVPQYTKGM